MRNRQKNLFSSMVWRNFKDCGACLPSLVYKRRERVRFLVFKYTSGSDLYRYTASTNQKIRLAIGGYFLAFGRSIVVSHLCRKSDILAFISFRKVNGNDLWRKIFLLHFKSTKLIIFSICRN